MPTIQTYERRSFAPFPIDYSSETFTPLVKENQQISHVRYLLQGQHASLARFRHYLMTCSTIFALEQTLRELRDNRDYVFADFITPDVVHWFQPFLVQTHRQMQAPTSTATTSNTSSTQPQPIP